MKLSLKILLFLFFVMIVGLLSANILLKKQYNALDKSDNYWTYIKVLEQPFRHLYITGGNDTHIFYEQSRKSSVRLLQDWANYHGGEVKASVRNDTLYLDFDYVPANPFEKYWLENATPVRIFSPELLSVTGNNINFEMHKLKQQNITATITGKSKFEVESMLTELDSVRIYQSDSSAVKFEMSPDYNQSPGADQPQKTVTATVSSKTGTAMVNVRLPATQKSFNESMSIRSLTATIKDHSILDVGHAQVQQLQVQVTDSSAIVLSGQALRKMMNN